MASIVYGNHPGTWRPSLEEIAPDDFAQLTRDVAAENVRRGLRLDEALRAQLSYIEGQLVQRFRERRTVTELEHDYQWAEALSIAWAERAAALAKGGEAPKAWWVPALEYVRKEGWRTDDQSALVVIELQLGVASEVPQVLSMKSFRGGTKKTGPVSPEPDDDYLDP